MKNREIHCFNFLYFFNSRHFIIAFNLKGVYFVSVKNNNNLKNN